MLRLLIVDDSPDDAEQTSDLLRKAGYMLKTQRVQDAGGLQSEIAKASWDVVVVEMELGHFNTQLALDMIKRANIDIPVIVLTRRISESDALKFMRAGAHDVLIKGNALRLPAVIERELTSLRHREHARRAEAALAEIENKHRSLIETSREAICYTQDGMHVDANRAYIDLFGYASLDALEGVPFLNLVDKPDYARVKDFLRKAGSKPSSEPLEFQARGNNDARFHAELSVSPLTIKGEPCQQMIVSDISKRKAAEQKLLYLNRHDALTGLFNRHYFLQELAKAVEAAKTRGAKGVMLYIDVDQLRNINDEFGFEIGDRLLLRLAKLFRDKLRGEDVLARLSGDEFGALMTGVDTKQAEAIAADINKTLKEAPLSEGDKVRTCQCTVSVIEIDAQVSNTHSVLMRAHQAHAKAKGRSDGAKPAVPAPPPASAPAATEDATHEGSVSAAHDISASAPAPTDRAAYANWHKRIEAALANNKFHIVYQPIVNLHADASEIYEVLARMTGEDNAVVSAGEFMSAADESGQVQQIDRAVLGQVIEAVKKVKQQGKTTRFFINLSHWTVCDAHFVPFLLDSLRAADLNGRSLSFEIDESTILRYPNETTAFIQAVRKLGCEITVDNFTMSSLQFVRQQPINFLKISGALIHNLSSDQVNQNLVQTIGRMAKSLDKRTIAKYVERADSLSMLWTFEIDYVQGHYFQAPHPTLAYEFDIESVSSDHAVASWVSPT